MSGQPPCTQQPAAAPCCWLARPAEEGKAARREQGRGSARWGEGAGEKEEVATMGVDRKKKKITGHG